MSESSDTPEAPKPSAGTLLSTARAATDMTRVAVAEALHLDPELVEAMESDDYDRMGAPVFARGHLRKYANLLALDADEVLSSYDASQDPSELPPVVAPIRKPPISAALPPRWLAAAALVLAALALLIWYLTSDDASTEAEGSALPTAESSALATPVATDENNVATPASAELISGVNSQATGETVVATEPVPAASDVAVETVAETQADVLVLTFSGDCWTEVRDADARRLYSATAVGGERVVLEGRSPFDLVLGNRRAVRIELNGAALAIPGSAIRGRTARFATPASSN